MASPSSREKFTIPGAPVQQFPHWVQENRNLSVYHSGSVDGIKGIYIKSKTKYIFINLYEMNSKIFDIYSINIGFLYLPNSIGPVSLTGKVK